MAGVTERSSVSNGLAPQLANENDDQPLLIRSLSRNLAASGEESTESNSGNTRVLNTFFGVFVPVALSQFSTTVFLRLGFVLGQSGLLQTLLQFFLAYGILVITVLSICAVSTNGAVEGGGAYYMISRALGPEFGGSIGLLFFFANIFSCAVYISGFVEGVVDGWGSKDGLEPGHPLPTGRWYEYGYGTVVLLVCLAVCMIGSQMYAKTLFFIFGVIIICIGSVIVSYVVPRTKVVDIPCINKYTYNQAYHNGLVPINSTMCGKTIFYDDPNSTLSHYVLNGSAYFLTADYTGPNSTTFRNNLYDKYNETRDYTSPHPDKSKPSFFVVFAVLFSGVTGIMNGANMSGELKNPGRSIPVGTLVAVLTTFVTYILLSFLTAATTTSDLLQGDYNFLKDVNLSEVFVYVGIFSATLSAALGNLIGASRVLEALAKDDQFWIFTRPARIVSKSGNPYVSVLISWLLVQLVLIIGAMNAIAPMATVFFLLSYASVNVACLALELASAPNFRPTFKYFSVWTSVVGFICCMVMTFFINSIYAAVAIVIAVILVIILYFRSLSNGWGSISQALIFHQVRKYLLMLDSRKDHVKFWRPQMLFMVSNPRQSANIIDFVNDLKKSGLFILGHVKLGNLDSCRKDPALTEQSNWLSLIDYLKVKAFVEITLANTVREGLQQLVRISGLGGMKPNTICLGFYDDTPPKDTFQIGRRKKKFGFGAVETAESNMAVNYFRLVRSASEEKNISVKEYVNMIRDCVKMQKNVCLFRHFHNLDKENAHKLKSYIDVWPVNIWVPDNSSYMDNCSLYVLQLACVLHMVKGWKQSTSTRVFMCHTGNEVDAESRKRKLDAILKKLRIDACIIPICWSKIVDLHYPAELRTQLLFDTPLLPEEYIQGVNQLIKEQSSNSAVVFTYLPLPPLTESHSEDYLNQLTSLTEGLPPTVLVHGLSPVTSTTL